MATKQIKQKILIFTDLDETLLKENKFYYNILNSFIKKILSHDCVIIPVTSKTYLEVIDILKQIKYKLPFSIENGAAYYLPIKNTKDYLYKKILNPYAVNKMTIKKILNKNIFKNHLKYIKFIENLPFSDQKKITKLNSKQLKNFNSRQYTIPIVLDGDEHFKNFFEASLLKYNLKIISGGKLINISGLHSKLNSLNFFTDEYKKKFSNERLITISLGDNHNDIEILNYSNYSGIIKNKNYKITNLKKKNNIFRSFTGAPYGWVETIKKILIKMERDYY